MLVVAIIVYDTDCKEKTIEFFDDPIMALKHKRNLESYGSEVSYIDIPTISVRDAEKVYEAVV